MLGGERGLWRPLRGINVTGDVTLPVIGQMSWVLDVTLPVNGQTHLHEFSGGGVVEAEHLGVCICNATCDWSDELGITCKATCEW
jgi:hypothetical protein